jgi:nickel-dependent lactate racemase
VAERNLKAVLAPQPPLPGSYTDAELITGALATPIGTPRLRELAEGKQKVLIVASDHTRVRPSQLTLKLLLEEIRVGAPAAEINIIVAGGMTHQTTPVELRQLFGDEIVEREKISVHYADGDMADMRLVGRLSSGNVLAVHHLAVECDLLVTEGCVQPHFFAGFSGGRKSILPGISARKTIQFNHAKQASPQAITGVLRNNPIHEDMLEAARAVKVDFILNVALNQDKQLLRVFAGDLEAAHLAGCRFIHSYSHQPPTTAEIVVVGSTGFPLSQYLLQASKAVQQARHCAGENGVIILVSALNDEAFREMLSTPGEKEWQMVASGLAEVLAKHTLIVVTATVTAETLRQAGLLSAKTPDEALEIAYTLKGKDAGVAVIPDGTSVFFLEEMESES